jgi:hypothetical protein
LAQSLDLLPELVQFLLFGLYFMLLAKELLLFL